MDENMNENMSENTSETVGSTAEKKEETVTISISEYKTLKKKRSVKKGFLFSFFGIFLSLGVALSFVALYLVIDYISWYVVAYPSNNYEESFPIMLILLALSLISIGISFLFLAKATKDNKKKRRIVLLSLLAFFILYYGAFAIMTTQVAKSDIKETKEAIRVEEARKKAEEEAEARRNTLKYTDYSIEYLKAEIERYPLKHQGATVTIEGYAASCELNYCFISLQKDKKCNENTYISFPEYTTDVMLIYYSIKQDVPRILDGDYVVATGIVNVKRNSDDEICVYLDITDYAIVPDPNDPEAQEPPTTPNISDNNEEELKSSSFFVPCYIKPLFLLY
ncbi:MAG: hypothetical protein IJ038_02880 [Clostridia bacterium]|nr:hypothetical protein [Clostridia bacterium]